MILIAFNLIPIPPLDGSHVIKYLLPASWSFKYMQLSRAGLVVLIAVMYLAPGALGVWLGPAMSLAYAMLGLVQTTVLPGTAQWIR